MKICFLSLNSYPMLANKNLGFAGGAELQQVLLARELTSYGCDVSFVTYDHGQKNISYVEKIRVLKAYRREDAHKADPFSKLGRILKALSKADADIYFYSAGSHGVLPLLSFLKKKGFVYRVPSDGVVLQQSDHFGSRLAQNLDIRKAGAVVVQSEFQKRKLAEKFRVDGAIIKSAIRLTEQKSKKSTPPIVLWVASIRETKRPKLFLDLANRIPDANFEMIGGETRKESHLYKEVREYAKDIENLSFLGFVPYYEIDDHFKKASIFVNTSTLEGFPNTFLQAWANSVPVVSLRIDPDGVLMDEKIGLCSGSFERLVSDVKTLLQNDELRTEIGNRARGYVEKEHSLKEATRKYIGLFDRVI